MKIPIRKEIFPFSRLASPIRNAGVAKSPLGTMHGLDIVERASPHPAVAQQIAYMKQKFYSGAKGL